MFSPHFSGVIQQRLSYPEHRLRLPITGYGDTMDDPELSSDETVLAKAQRISVKSIPFEAILTNRRILLIDREKNLLPPKKIPLTNITETFCGEDRNAAPTLTLGVMAPTGVTRQIVLTFQRLIRANPTRERDDWVKKIRKATSPAPEKKIPKTVTRPGPSLKQDTGTGTGSISPPAKPAPATKRTGVSLPSGSGKPAPSPVPAAKMMVAPPSPGPRAGALPEPVKKSAGPGSVIPGPTIPNPAAIPKHASRPGTTPPGTAATLPASVAQNPDIANAAGPAAPSTVPASKKAAPSGAGPGAARQPPASMPKKTGSSLSGESRTSPAPPEPTPKKAAPSVTTVAREILKPPAPAPKKGGSVTTVTRKPAPPVAPAKKPETSQTADPSLITLRSSSRMSTPQKITPPKSPAADTGGEPVLPKAKEPARPTVVRGKEWIHPSRKIREDSIPAPSPDPMQRKKAGNILPEAPLSCPRCAHVVPPGSRFCDNCGARINVAP